MHLGYADNRAAYAALPAHPNDWLVLGGDIGETEEHLNFALDVATKNFAKVLWVPGNHELWSTKSSALRGVEKYQKMVELCRRHGALTPEDAYARWPDDPNLVLVPMFLLYDYSFRPEGVDREHALDWAMESGVVCQDEVLLDPTPYESRDEWCRTRCDQTEARLRELAPTDQTVLINHFPLREELAFLPRVPRFKLWCGTKRTEDWHVRYRARIVVSGHLHIRSTKWRDGVRFDEVSLGYPKQWIGENPIGNYLREIIPGLREPSTFDQFGPR